MAKLADALDSGSSARKGVRVQIPPSAPNKAPMPYIALRLPFALALSIICLTAPAWADFKTGMDAYQRSDYATALREWQPLAEQGQAVAQYQLGLLYANGKGVTKDDAKARQWYEKAAVQGNAWAQAQIGQLYATGRGVPQDYITARGWYEKAAAQGNAWAQAQLSLM